MDLVDSYPAHMLFWDSITLSELTSPEGLNDFSGVTESLEFPAMPPRLCLYSIQVVYGADIKHWRRSDVILPRIRREVHGFRPGRGSGFLRAIKIYSTPSFGGEVKPEAPYKILRHVRNH
jgi:hypothetical protein